MYVLVLIFSKKVFRPVAASYEKQKQFITDASHELKTPLTIISANVEVLEMELADMEAEKFLNGQGSGDFENTGEENEIKVAENTWIKSIKNQV